jgi:hypothetical protein
MGEQLFKWLPLIFGILSCLLWLLTSFISIPSGWDSDPRQAYKKIAWLNAAAALCAAISIGLQTYIQA